MSDPEGKIRIINPDGQIITIHKDEIKAVDYGASIIIIKPKDENTVDLRTSCNKAVAVAKLFGWMKGSTFPKVMVPFGKGDTYLDLVRFLEEKNALQDMLSQMRDVASEELAAAEADATSEELKEKQEAVANIDWLIKRAFTYVSDIDEELTKGDNSALKIDQKASEEKTRHSHNTKKSRSMGEGKVRYIHNG